MTSVVVLYEDGTAVMPALEEDQLGIIANIQPMITFSNDISEYSVKFRVTEQCSVGKERTSESYFHRHEQILSGHSQSR